MTVSDTIKKYQDHQGFELECETTELLAFPRDLYEASHEYADGNQDVIYYARAHECIKNATSDESAYAEDTMTETCGYEDSPTYDQIAVRLAFWVISYRYQNTVTADLEALRDWMDENEIESEETEQAIVDILGR